MNWDHQRTYSEIKEQHYNEQVLIHSFNFIFTFALQIFWKSTETFSKINFWDLEAFMIIVRAQKGKNPHMYLTYMIPTWTIFSIWKVAPYWPWCILDLDTTVATITTSDSNMYSANNLKWSYLVKLLFQKLNKLKGLKVPKLKDNNQGVGV